MSDNPDVFAITPSASGRLLCGGCASGGACRLGVELAAERGAAVRCDVTCPRSWHGGPDVAHGGWIAAVVDNVLNLAALCAEPQLVTKSLTISYLCPVPAERPLMVHARIDTDSGTRWEIFAQMTLTTGPTLGTGRAELRTRLPDQYARHENGLARRTLSRTGFHTETDGGHHG